MRTAEFKGPNPVKAVPAGDTEEERDELSDPLVLKKRQLLRIAIFVHGRFHAFDLARALIARGHFVRVLTNYPNWATRRFGLPDCFVERNVLHGLASRIANKVSRINGGFDATPALHRWFGRWAARRLSTREYDVIHGFTGVAEEPLLTMNSPVHTLVRGSAHIRTQSEILAAEQERFGARIDLPSAWSIAREEREYRLADSVLVLSSFAHRTFLEQGFAPDRLRVVPLGVDTRRFRPDHAVLTERLERIRLAQPLRVLTVGTFSLRKGVLDYFEIVSQLHERGFRFRFVGAIEPEAQPLARELAGKVEFIPRQKQSSLPDQYAWGDLFLFPTLEDGFAVVLTQAQAACLPLLTTTNSSGPDLVTDERAGWVLPIRDPAAFVERFLWCAGNRERLAEMVKFLGKNHAMRDWNDVALDFETTMYDLIRSRQQHPLP